MKQMVFILCAMLMVLFFSIPVLSIGEYTTRSRKLEDATASVTQEVLEETMESATEADTDIDILKSEVRKRIKNRLGEKADIEVSIKGADLKRGLLSVEVSETYRGIRDASHTLETKKTCILEREAMRPMIPVCFYLPDITPDTSSTYTLGYERLYRKYELQSGEDIILPESPHELLIPVSKEKCDTYRFKGWRLVKENEDSVPYKDVKSHKAGSTFLSFDGSLYGGIAFEAEYVKQ